MEQFIPSGRNWKGWVKIAFQQPLVPVLPVAREIISKTKWVSRGHHHNDASKRNGTPKPQGRENSIIPKRLRTISTMSNKAKPAPYDQERNLSALGLVTEPTVFTPDEVPHEEVGRRAKRQLLKVFKRRRSKSQPRSSIDSTSSTSVSNEYSIAAVCAHRLCQTVSSYSNSGRPSTPDTARPVLAHHGTSDPLL